MIFTTFPHSLNTTDVDTYFFRAEGRRFCLDTMIKGIAPIAPLDPPAGGNVGPAPRLDNGRVQKAFYVSLFALSLKPHRPPEMTCGGIRMEWKIA